MGPALVARQSPPARELDPSILLSRRLSSVRREGSGLSMAAGGYGSSGTGKMALVGDDCEIKKDAQVGELHTLCGIKSKTGGACTTSPTVSDHL